MARATDYYPPALLVTKSSRIRSCCCGGGADVYRRHHRVLQLSGNLLPSAEKLEVKYAMYNAPKCTKDVHQLRYQANGFPNLSDSLVVGL